MGEVAIGAGILFGIYALVEEDRGYLSAPGSDTSEGSFGIQPSITGGAFAEGL